MTKLQLLKDLDTQVAYLRTDLRRGDLSIEDVAAFLEKMTQLIGQMLALGCDTELFK